MPNTACEIERQMLVMPSMSPEAGRSFNHSSRNLKPIVGLTKDPLSPVDDR